MTYLENPLSFPRVVEHDCNYVFAAWNWFPTKVSREISNFVYSLAKIGKIPSCKIIQVCWIRRRNEWSLTAYVIQSIYVFKGNFIEFLFVSFFTPIDSLTNRVIGNISQVFNPVTVRKRSKNSAEWKPSRLEIQQSIFLRVKVIIPWESGITQINTYNFTS